MKSYQSFKSAFKIFSLFFIFSSLIMVCLWYISFFLFLCFFESALSKLFWFFESALSCISPLLGYFFFSIIFWNVFLLHSFSLFVFCDSNLYVRPFLWSQSSQRLICFNLLSLFFRLNTIFWSILLNFPSVTSNNLKAQLVFLIWIFQFLVLEFSCYPFFTFPIFLYIHTLWLYFSFTFWNKVIMAWIIFLFADIRLVGGWGGRVGIDMLHVRQEAFPKIGSRILKQEIIKLETLWAPTVKEALNSVIWHVLCW